MDIRTVVRYLQAATSVSATRARDGTQSPHHLCAIGPGRSSTGCWIRSAAPLARGDAGTARHARCHRHAPPQTVSSVEPYRELVLHPVSAAGGRNRHSAAAARTGLRRRLSSRLPLSAPAGPTRPTVATVRVEREPGSEAQVDFGYAGLLLDPQTGALRKAWAFVMVLSYSRHQYVEFVFDQQPPDLDRPASPRLCLLRRRPGRVVLDNLKAGITRACFDDPQIQPTYRECAEHYGFLLAPCAPRTPEHKGKVEQGGVHYVKQNFLGGRAPTTLTQANADVLEWCRTTAGLRRHGTTKDAPLERFERTNGPSSGRCRRRRTTWRSGRA